MRPWPPDRARCRVAGPRSVGMFFAWNANTLCNFSLSQGWKTVPGACGVKRALTSPVVGRHRVSKFVLL